MNSILLALSPFITSALTGALKNVGPFANLSDNARPAVIRLLAAVIALAYAIAGVWISGAAGQDSLGVAVTAFIDALVVWLGSLGVFHAWFAKK